MARVGRCYCSGFGWVVGFVAWGMAGYRGEHEKEFIFCTWGPNIDLSFDWTRPYFGWWWSKKEVRIRLYLESSRVRCNASCSFCSVSCLFRRSKSCCVASLLWGGSRRVGVFQFGAKIQDHLQDVPCDICPFKSHINQQNHLQTPPNRCLSVPSTFEACPGSHEKSSR